MVSDLTKTQYKTRHHLKKKKRKKAKKKQQQEEKKHPILHASECICKG